MWTDRKGMKRFEMRELYEAIAHALDGGQALHLMEHSGGLYPNAPEPFRQTSRFAHLFDQDRERLVRTARRLGIRKIVIGREGTRQQHVDLCGPALDLAEHEARAGARAMP